MKCSCTMPANLLYPMGVVSLILVLFAVVWCCGKLTVMEKLELNGIKAVICKVGVVLSWLVPEQQMSWAFVHRTHLCHLAILLCKGGWVLIPHLYPRTSMYYLRKVSFNQEKGFFFFFFVENDFRMIDIHQLKYPKILYFPKCLMKSILLISSKAEWQKASVGI